MNLCLIAAGAIVRLGVGATTLAWTHSVQKILWEEDWQATPGGLVLTEARVRGTGAGMEPPPEAHLRNGVWSWRPALPALPSVTLRRSHATADWRLCTAGTCRRLGSLVPEEADPVRLTTCPP